MTRVRPQSAGRRPAAVRQVQICSGAGRLPGETVCRIEKRRLAPKKKSSVRSKKNNPFPWMNKGYREIMEVIAPGRPGRTTACSRSSVFPWSSCKSTFIDVLSCQTDVTLQE